MVRSSNYQVGYPILNHGRKWYPVLKVYEYRAFGPYMPDKIVEYFEIQQWAEDYVKESNSQVHEQVQ